MAFPNALQIYDVAGEKVKQGREVIAENKCF